MIRPNKERENFYNFVGRCKDCQIDYIYNYPVEMVSETALRLRIRRIEKFRSTVRKAKKKNYSIGLFGPSLTAGTSESAERGKLKTELEILEHDVVLGEDINDPDFQELIENEVIETNPAILEKYLVSTCEILIILPTSLGSVAELSLLNDIPNKLSVFIAKNQDHDLGYLNSELEKINLSINQVRDVNYRSDDLNTCALTTNIISLINKKSLIAYKIKTGR